MNTTNPISNFGTYQQSNQIQQQQQPHFVQQQQQQQQQFGLRNPQPYPQQHFGQSNVGSGQQFQQQQHMRGYDAKQMNFNNQQIRGRTNTQHQRPSFQRQKQQTSDPFASLSLMDNAKQLSISCLLYTSPSPRDS